MMARQTRKSKPTQERKEAPVEEIKVPATDEAKKAALDDLLDEIDEVLEENASDFVKSYVQKGGQ